MSGLPGVETEVVVLTPPFAKRPAWHRAAIVAAGMVLSAAAIVAINGLFPFLNALLAPASVLSMGALAIVAEAIIFSAVNGNSIRLAPEGVEQRWGPSRRTLPAEAIDRIYTFQGPRRRWHGVVTRNDRSISFGGGYTAEDFEVARRWLRAFAEARQLRYATIPSVPELGAFISGRPHG